jgi:hypothetical protein
MKKNISWVSLTGAEDSVDPGALVDMSQEHPQAEWALLCLFEREGAGRNPTQAWRESFLDRIEGHGRSALHLCGKESFDRLLRTGPWDELGRYDRIQANINARSQAFDKEQTMEIWTILSTQTRGLIIQLHDNVRPWAMEFLERQRLGARVEVLFDESKGRGVAPDAWTACLDGLACGYAGGLGPENVEQAMPLIAKAASAPGCWIDMETRLRSEGLFDLDKCRQVLERSEPWINDAARQVKKIPSVEPKP